MTHHNARLASLIGSRICHDLISPVGAIGNGLELIEMTGAGRDEMALISDSLEGAKAMIGYFRIAFGIGSAGQEVTAREISEILDAMAPTRRAQIAWDMPRSLPRSELRLLFLALMCAETALPFGGTIAVTGAAGGWTVTAEGKRTRILPELWDILSAPDTDAAPQHVHFILLGVLLQDDGRAPQVDLGENAVTLAF